MHFRNREERELHMDSLERQIKHQLAEMQRSLDQMEGSVRGRRALTSKLRSSLTGFPGRASVADIEEATEGQDGEAPRSWWEFWR